LCDNIYGYMCYYNLCHGIVIISVEVFWAVCDNTRPDVTEMMLKEALNIYVLICGKNALKQTTVHSFINCCVHVLPNNAANQKFTR
jgi:hypothetical protein